MTIIKINNTVVDLFPDTIVAVTVQRYSVGDLNARFISRTNEIVLPLTSTNLRLFEIENKWSDGTAPYQRLSCSVTQNGIELISYGVALLNRVEDGIRVEIYDSDLDYFDALKDLTLFDALHNSSYTLTPSAFTAAGIDAKRATTDGVICPMIDWGRLLNFTYYQPSYFYHTPIKAIAESINVDASEISSNSLFNSDIDDLVWTVHKKPSQYNDRFKEYFYVKGDNALAQSNSVTFNVEVTNVNDIGEIGIFAGTKIQFPNYTTSNYVNINVYGEYRFEAAGAVGNTFVIELVKFIPGSGTFVVIDSATWVMAAAALIVENTLSGNVDVAGLDEIKYRIRITSGSPTVTIPANRGKITLYSNFTVFREWVFYDFLLPLNLKAIDFFKDWLVRFGVVFKPVDGKLFVKKLDDILSDRASAVDWSGKFVRTTNEKFRSDYAKENYFRFADNEETEGLGEGTISTFGSNNQDSKEIFKSTFNTCPELFTNRINMAYVPVYDSTSTGWNDTKEDLPITLFTIRDRQTVEPGIVIDVSNRLDYKVGYFNDPAFTVNTTWQYFLDLNYPVFKDSINKAKISEAFYYLTEVDVNEFDPFKLVYDNGEYFLISKIDNFIPGKITKVERFRV